jgi:hypothetical protein
MSRTLTIFIDGLPYDQLYKMSSTTFSADAPLP